MVAIEPRGNEADCTVGSAEERDGGSCVSGLELADFDGYIGLQIPTPEELKVRVYYVPLEYYELLALRDRIVEFAVRNELPFVMGDGRSVIDGKWGLLVLLRGRAWKVRGAGATEAVCDAGRRWCSRCRARKSVWGRLTLCMVAP